MTISPTVRLSREKSAAAELFQKRTSQALYNNFDFKPLKIILNSS